MSNTVIHRNQDRLLTLAGRFEAMAPLCLILGIGLSMYCYFELPEEFSRSQAMTLFFVVLAYFFQLLGTRYRIAALTPEAGTDAAPREGTIG